MPRILLDYSVIEFRLSSLLQYWYRHASVYFKGNFANAALHLGLEYQFFQVLGACCDYAATEVFIIQVHSLYGLASKLEIARTLATQSNNY